MRLLPNDIDTLVRNPDPEMLILGVAVGYKNYAPGASPEELAFVKATVHAMLLAAICGGYRKQEFGLALVELIQSQQPMEDATEIFSHITPQAWGKAMRHPSFSKLTDLKALR